MLLLASAPSIMNQCYLCGISIFCKGKYVHMPSLFIALTPAVLYRIPQHQWHGKQRPVW